MRYRYRYRICVIGAGINGLCVTKHLIDNNLTNITMFESTNRSGGLWNYEPDPSYPMHCIKISPQIYIEILCIFLI